MINKTYDLKPIIHFKKIQSVLSSVQLSSNYEEHLNCCENMINTFKLNFPHESSFYLLLEDTLKTKQQLVS